MWVFVRNWKLTLMLIECISQSCRYSRSFPAVSVIFLHMSHDLQDLSLTDFRWVSFFVPWKQNLHLARRAAVCKLCNKDWFSAHVDRFPLSSVFVHRSKTHVWWEKTPDASFSNKDVKNGWGAYERRVWIVIFTGFLLNSASRLSQAFLL